MIIIWIIRVNLIFSFSCYLSFNFGFDGWSEFDKIVIYNAILYDNTLIIRKTNNTYIVINFFVYGKHRILKTQWYFLLLTTLSESLFISAINKIIDILSKISAIEI